MNKAIAVFNDKVKGRVIFTQENDIVFIDIQLSGLKKNALHGFHVHESGNLTQGCKSLCAHFNPYKTNHGCPGAKVRHVGDLGNIITDSQGKSNYIIFDDVIKLKGVCNIIGRGLVIHADPDDCGIGNAESLKTGNAGERIACAIIGYY
jgi:Cu-Zn family superoxide dismutase